MKISRCIIAIFSATSFCLCSTEWAVAAVGGGAVTKTPSKVLGVSVVNNGPVMLGANVTCTATLSVTPDDDRYYWFVWTYERTGWAEKLKAKLKSTMSVNFSDAKYLGTNTLSVYICSNEFCVPPSIVSGETTFVVSATIPVSVNLSQLYHVDGGTQPPAYSSVWPLYLTGSIYDPDNVLAKTNILYQWMLPSGESNSTNPVATWTNPTVGLYNIIANVYATPTRSRRPLTPARAAVAVPNNGTGSSGFFAVLDPVTRLRIAGPRRVSDLHVKVHYRLTCTGTGPVHLCWDLAQTDTPVGGTTRADDRTGCVDVEKCAHNLTFSFTKSNDFKLKVSATGRINSETAFCYMSVGHKTSGRMTEAAVIATIFSMMGLLVALTVLAVLVYRLRAGRGQHVEVADFDFHVNRDRFPWYKEALARVQAYWSLSASTKLNDLNVVQEDNEYTPLCSTTSGAC